MLLFCNIWLTSSLLANAFSPLLLPLRKRGKDASSSPSLLPVSVPQIGVQLEIPNIDGDNENEQVVDSRPFGSRAERPRAARRLNHAFKYLYRHSSDQSATSKWASCEEFLRDEIGYTPREIKQMNTTFPPLLELDVKRHVRPKLRFLTETIGLTLEQIREDIAPQYFGARLERILAPRHAFLVYNNLPHGLQLFDDPDMDINGSNKWNSFLLSCRKPKQFCALCNTWKAASGDHSSPFTIKQIEAFDVMFQRGLMPAARDELCQLDNPWPLDHINITSGEMVSLLIQHGANPLERDARGATLLHWAAGTGNLGASQVLLDFFKDGVFTDAQRDGATPLHWAAAGADAREFGIGGHLDVCRFLLAKVDGDAKRKLINQLTKDGNSVLMWAAWSGTLDVVKLLVRNRADALVANRNGCTVAHWASSGGNLEVCKYLAETIGIDFTISNHGGNTPLTHAVAFGRVEIVEWLRNDVVKHEDDSIASALAEDFVHWTDGDDKRKQVLSLFQDWFGDDDDPITSGADTSVAESDQGVDNFF